MVCWFLDCVVCGLFVLVGLGVCGGGVVGFCCFFGWVGFGGLLGLGDLDLLSWGCVGRRFLVWAALCCWVGVCVLGCLGFGCGVGGVWFGFGVVGCAWCFGGWCGVYWGGFG
ncbi:hypothetical protein, partial [Neisseria sp. P0021.S004]|uniref:hypothetical protein n=1 Tax=Neisseria sp. P0021.S004 TaxID=3436819 RepID=UPI003F7FBC03